MEACKQMENEAKEANSTVRENAAYFLGVSLAFGVCFAIAFYRNYAGITFPLITAAMLAVCGLFLKKSGIPWKTSNWLYAGAILMLGVSTALTANGFVIFFNTIGILLLVTVFMLRQAYDASQWGFGQYLCNILFFGLSMVPEVASPFIHLGNYWRKARASKEGEKGGNGKYVIAGILIGLPMLLCLVELLSGADQIFSNLVGEMLHTFWSQAVFSPNLFLAAMLLAMGFWDATASCPPCALGICRNGRRGGGRKTLWWPSPSFP